MRQYVPPTGFSKLLRKAFYGKYANWPKTFWFYTFFNGIAKKRIKEKAAKGEKLNVIFFVLNISMWKYESLFKLLLKDNRFNPVIIPYPLLWESEDILKKSEKDIVDYCKKMGFPYKIGYDIDSKTYTPAKELKADFVSYSQPYNNCPDFWKVEKFYKEALIFSYPYGIPVDNNNSFTHLLVNNVSWRLFYPNTEAKRVYQTNPFSKGRNFRWVGITIFDKLADYKPDYSVWKQSDPKIKRVIWAPHHTIDDTDDLPFSTFMIYAEEMIKIAKEYSGRIQFVFKPHPILKERLITKWGKDRVEEYYRTWEEMENTTAGYGDYTDFFMTSDALIHDCCGFMMEYMFTGHPALYLVKKDIKPYIPEFSYSFFLQHYHAKTRDEIRSFLDNVILKGEDTMESSRRQFYKSKLMPPNGCTVGINMYQDFIKALQ